MTTETVLTDEQIESALISAGYVRADFKLTPQALANSRAIEQAVLQRLITDADCIERAARSLAGSFDYPWDFMTNEGRENMREHARAAIDDAMEKQT